MMSCFWRRDWRGTLQACLAKTVLSALDFPCELLLVKTVLLKAFCCLDLLPNYLTLLKPIYLEFIWTPVLNSVQFVSIQFVSICIQVLMLSD